MTRHSREDAISDKQFDRLYTAADGMAEPFRLDCLFVLISAGRLGLRAGEICHASEDWINWEQRQLEIPMHDPCTGGRDGGVCGYCRDRARKRAELAEDVTVGEALAERWEPKTANGARAVPFGFDKQVVDVLEEFFMFRDGFSASRSAVNRRVDRMLDAADLPRSLCFPHSLRATAAMYHASRGVTTAALQVLMGWSKLATAQSYIRLSGAQTRRALQEAHGDD
jgi:integrase